MTRTFDDRPAVREKTPVLVGLVGPSGSGKTYSALRLAAGFQRVTGGETFVIDTEARRSLHYAEKFRFRHVAFGKPFSPLDYLEAINYCIGKGATTIVVDSMSHEHEGPGGVLEMHEAELDRMAGKDYGKRARMTMLAWSKPKAERRRLINSLLQMQCNFVFCFRAKQKVKMEQGKDPTTRGYQPIAGEEFIYEMTLKFLLLPGANGIPAVRSDIMDEQAMIKIPEQFRGMFGARAEQLSEDVGETLARWAAGSPASQAAKTTAAPELIERAKACSDPATLRTLLDEQRAGWPGFSKDEKASLKTEFAAAAKRVEEAAKTAPPADDSESEGGAPFSADDGAAA